MSYPSHSRCVVVRNPNGLHMRPATMLVQAACRYTAEICIERDGQGVDCKSILGILTLGATQGIQLTLHARGEDAEEALDTLVELFNQGFHEEDETVASPSSNG